MQCKHCGQDKDSVEPRDVGGTKKLVCRGCASKIRREKPKYTGDGD